MKIEEIVDVVNKESIIDYSKKVMLIRELFKLAIEILKEKNICVGEENPFKLLDKLKDDDRVKKILDVKEKLSKKTGDVLDS